MSIKYHALLTAALLAGAAGPAAARSLNVNFGSVAYSFPAATLGIVDISVAQSQLTATGVDFDLSEITSMNVTDTDLDNNTVTVTYNGSQASVTIAGNIARHVTAEVDGAHVSVTQSADVSETTCGEITYQLQGESTDGSFAMNGAYKASIELLGLALTSSKGAALDIQNGKRISVSAKSGTSNTLADCAGGSQKGAIVCKGHLEFKGKGELTVTGHTSHAIYAKEYVEMKNLSITIPSSVKDGINCAQYFSMESGTLNIIAPGDDAIQTSYKDDTDREAEDTGSITISGGTINATVTAAATKGLKADNAIIINGGNITITSNADGTWDSSKNKTKASACLGADGDIEINGGTLILSATGGGGKGISCDGKFTATDGSVTIATTGGLLCYTNGTLSQNYTGNTDRIDSDLRSAAKGIKADSGVEIAGGNFHITTATNNAEGIESKTTMLISGGTIFVKAYDDGINSTSDLTVTGGDLTVISIAGDGIDSNANLTIAGGNVITLGSGGMEMGLDAATESGCAVYITGGNLLSFGGSNTYPTKSGSTQAYVTASGSISAETVITVSRDGETLVSFTVPAEYTASTGSSTGPGGRPGFGGWGPGGASGNGSMMISAPAMVKGTSYTIANGTQTSTATAVTTSTGR